MSNPFLTRRLHRRTPVPRAGTRRFQRSQHSLITGFLTRLGHHGPRDAAEADRRLEAARRLLRRSRAT